MYIQFLICFHVLLLLGVTIGKEENEHRNLIAMEKQTCCGHQTSVVFAQEVNRVVR